MACQSPAKCTLWKPKLQTAQVCFMMLWHCSSCCAHRSLQTRQEAACVLAGSGARHRPLILLWPIQMLKTALS